MKPEHDWNAIVRDLAPSLYKYFCASFSSVISEDLVQVTLARLYEKTAVAEFDPRKGHLRMYAYGIARNVRLEHHRSVRPRFAQQESVEELTSEVLSPEQELIDSDEVQKLREAIRQLSNIQQDVLGLYLDEELTIDQMGLILNIPPNTVKSHIRRAKESLLHILRPNKENRK